jgi:F-type H+-transporting ATPase subunit epsilon
MKCQLLTLAGSQYDGDFTEVLITTASGMMVILPHHQPLTAVIKPGPVTIHNHAQKDTFAIFGGILEITPDAVSILADVAEHSDDLVHDEIEAALAEAEHLKATAGTMHEMHHAQAMIDRHQVRLDVIKIHRRRHTRTTQH